MNCGASSPLIFNVQSFINSQCDECGDNTCISAEYVCYKGANLSCSGIETNDSLETALTKIDEQICSAIGDYSTYQKNCLPTWFGEEINDESTFVDAITAYACTIAINLESFTGTTFPQYQTSVAAQISQIDGPALTCTAAGVNSGDSLSDILTKYCAKFADLDDELDMTDVDFGECFTIGGVISTVKQGFEELVSQICQVKAIAEDGSGILPTFNNVGSCLDSPTSSDSLEDTVIKIRTTLCGISETYNYNGEDIDWGCDEPDGDSLQEAIQTLADTRNDYLLNGLTAFSDDFVITQTDEGNPCSGKTITLATPINQDRFVAADDEDDTPGTLIDKLVGVTGINVYSNVDDNTVEIASEGKIFASSADDSDIGYLIDKLEGSTVNGITITPVFNALTNKVTLQLSIDPEDFCTAVSNCVPAPCIEYTITNNAGGTRSVGWMDCANNVVSISIPNGGSVTACAILGSVSGDGVTIVPTGDCTTTTTAAP